MPVKISPASSKSSNKPQPVPKPKPPFEWFPTVLTMDDGRKVRVSVPIPDRLTMVIDITSAIYGKNAPAGLPVAQWSYLAGKYLASGEHYAAVLDSQYFNDPPWYKHVTLGMGDRDSSVRFEFSKATSKQPARLRIEMNPRKLGQKGAKKFLQILNAPNGPFKGKALLKWAHVTRLDIAIDVEGLSPNEVLAFHKSEQQRSIYVGADGELETVYLHGKATKTKPLGKALVSIYDRAKERIKKGKAPPFGPSPVTRVELNIGLKAPKNTLTHVAAKLDPYGALSVGYVLEQGATPEQWWRQYVAVRRTCSHAKAIALLGISKPTAAKFEAAYQVPQPNLVAKGLNWAGWKQGLKLTGLQLLIDAIA